MTLAHVSRSVAPVFRKDTRSAAHGVVSHSGLWTGALAVRYRAFERMLDRRILPARPTRDETPPRLYQAMRYAALSPGKRLRPLLVLTACEAVGGDWRRALPAAVAVELVHAFSLVHDDLPAMDDDDYRRGRLTTHKKYGEAMGILAGDALIAEAFSQLWRAGESPGSARARGAGDDGAGAGVGPRVADRRPGARSRGPRGGPPRAAGWTRSTAARPVR